MEHKKIFYLLASIILLAFFYQACDDSGILPEPSDVDTTAINYNNLIISERIPPFDSAYSSIDFFNGKIVREADSTKDAVLVDIDSTTYFLRSGDLSLDIPGFQARFKQFVYQDLTQAKFDTVKVIPDSDTTLTEADFESDRTANFTLPLTQHPVYGFYLKGKYDRGIWWKPVFGMVYIDSSWSESGATKFKVDVKINRAGENRFREIFK